MESLHLIARSQTVHAMQRELLGLGPTSSGTRATPDAAPRRPSELVAKLIAGLLVLALIGATAATVLADRPQRERHATSQEQGQKLAASKKKDKKSKTITRTFASETPIAIPAIGSDNDTGPGDPYPSTIDVSGFKSAKIADANVTLNGLSHDFAIDVLVVLVAPNGRNAYVMGDVGFVQNGSQEVTNLTLTLDDEAPAALPADEALTSGAFRPALGPDPGDLPAPAPTPSGNVALSTFDGIAPNGQWRLFVADNGNGDTGQLSAGWNLEITAKSKAKEKGKHKRKHGKRH
jgi:subtilisin-like proprotein convertase family protein